MPSPKENLLQVLRDTRRLLALPDNDFAWSSWEDARAALTELDFFISQIETDRPFDKVMLRALFLVTGPIKEVSASSGWGDEFWPVAARFDQAMTEYEKSLPPRKRSLLSQILCPLFAMGALVFLFFFKALSTHHPREASPTMNMEPFLWVLAALIVPILAYKVARRIFD